jgi:glycosyltransferase involved in cell wall biosynthesis
MKKISVYIGGVQTSPTYYRIYQYLNHRQGKFNISYRLMLPEWLYKKYMPISYQSLYIKLLAGVLMYFRILLYLITDYIHKPDTIVITRRVSKRIMPVYYKWLLRKIAKKAFVIWDYDDQIIDCGEVSQSTFNFYAEISDRIFCTHEHLAVLVPENYRNKVTLLATTDGDMYRNYNEVEMKKERLSTLTNEVKLVWVATSVNLPYMLMISPWLDNIAKELKQTKGKRLSLEVICNGTLDYDFHDLKLTNTRWTRQRAIDGMLNAHIGIMPLANTEFARGKGGFKLVQYISVGLPCVASNVGFNKFVLNDQCGFLAESEQQWRDAIMQLSNPNVWSQFSTAAFKQWNSNFSFDKNLAIWDDALSANK